MNVTILKKIRGKEVVPHLQTAERHRKETNIKESYIWFVPMKVTLGREIVVRSQTPVETCRQHTGNHQRPVQLSRAGSLSSNSRPPTSHLP